MPDKIVDLVVSCFNRHLQTNILLNFGEAWQRYIRFTLAWLEPRDIQLKSSAKSRQFERFLHAGVVLTYNTYWSIAMTQNSRTSWLKRRNHLLTKLVALEGCSGKRFEANSRQQTKLHQQIHQVDTSPIIRRTTVFALSRFVFGRKYQRQTLELTRQALVVDFGLAVHFAHFKQGKFIVGGFNVRVHFLEQTWCETQAIVRQVGTESIGYLKSLAAVLRGFVQ